VGLSVRPPKKTSRKETSKRPDREAARSRETAVDRQTVLHAFEKLVGVFFVPSTTPLALAARVPMKRLPD